ncbi:MAG: hypothetical protein K6G58_06980 [Lachnospiraceae bacterium]|nr:hypothetical protein [Lachnospiraceae bacterium]
MNGINPVNSKSGDFLQEIQKTIKEKLNNAKDEGSVSNVFDDGVAATLSISSSGIAQAGRAEREAILQQSIVQLEGGYRKFNLTDEEACILKSFRLEEYYDIRDRMKEEDNAYNDLLRYEENARKAPDPSEQFKVYAKAYNWAYGDIFDRIHKEAPDVDIYVKSPGMGEDHNYQMRSNRTALIISTDEIRLLQSSKDSDKKAQEELWNRILEKISTAREDDA